ncbi:MAG: hypothetical protein V7L04_31750 [Nostoc sp.]|uniref:hypothetical protein n=1 Tax=Nostoc sp. TaxID=1180 RepID=UPI002FF84325
MTAITDLTWQQLEDASGITGAIVVTGAGDTAKVMIDVSLVTGTHIGALSAGGVIDFLIKLREFAAAAQITVNVNQVAGEKLAAFPALTYGTLASDGKVQVQGNVVAKLAVSPQTLHAVGTNS